MDVEPARVATIDHDMTYQTRPVTDQKGGAIHIIVAYAGLLPPLGHRRDAA